MENGKQRVMNYVCGFMFSEDRRDVVLIQKKRPQWMANMWNGLGGRVHNGEGELDAMIREFKEEAGVDWRHWYKFCQMKWSSGNVHFFSAFSNECFNARTMTDEPVSVHKVMKLPHCVYNLRWLIPMAKDNFILTSSVLLKEKK